MDQVKKITDPCCSSTLINNPAYGATDSISSGSDVTELDFTLKAPETPAMIRMTPNAGLINAPKKLFPNTFTTESKC